MSYTCDLTVCTVPQPGSNLQACPVCFTIGPRPAAGDKCGADFV